jgi:transcriptional regulator with XRE-family HTH domain
VPTRDPGAAFLRAFGRAVRERRTALKLSQEDLGFRSELDRTYISGIERGVRNATLKVVVRLATALDTDPADLVGLARTIARGKGEWGKRGRMAGDHLR